MSWTQVDRLIECVPGVSAIGIKCYSHGDLFLLNEPAGSAQVPQVLLVEMIARTAHASYSAVHPNALPVVGVIKSADFSGVVRPGDRCVVRSKIRYSDADYLVAKGTVEVDGVVVAEAEILSPITRATDPDFTDPLVMSWLRGNTLQEESHEW